MNTKFGALLFSVLVLGSCSEGQNKDHIRKDFPESQVVSTHKAFDLDGDDDIKGMLLLNNKFYLENNKKSPLYNIYDKQGNKTGDFGVVGHGKNEFIMPNLCEGTNDTVFIIDNGSKSYYSIYDSNVVYKKPIKIGHNVNRVKTIEWPYIGYYYHAGNQLTWNLYDLKNNKIVASLPFIGETPYLETFVWDSNGSHLVFAYKYYNKLRLCTMSSEKTILKELVLDDGTQQPQESHCFYSDIICSNDFFFVISQEDITVDNPSGVSKVLLYDYEGNPLKELKLDRIYLQMAWDKTTKRLYFVPIDGNEITYTQL